MNLFRRINMSSDTFVQQRAYIYAPNPEEIKAMEDEKICGEDEIKDDDVRGVVIIDIFGE